MLIVMEEHDMTKRVATNVIIIGLVGFFAAACGSKKVDFQSEGASAQSLRQLNSLSTGHAVKYSVNFEYINYAGLLTFARGACSMVDCGSTPSPSVPYISGHGKLTGGLNGLLLAATDLDMGVTFDSVLANLNKGQDCLATAVSAFSHNNQLVIQGDATIVPSGSGSGSGSSESGSAGTSGTGAIEPNGNALTVVQTEANQVRLGEAPAPVFVSTSVAIVFTDIVSCTEGGPANRAPIHPAPSSPTNAPTNAGN